MSSHIYAYAQLVFNSAALLPRACPTCCGIGYYGGWVKATSNSNAEYLKKNRYVPIDELQPGYTNILYATFNKEKSNLDALEEIRKYHTISYESDWIINNSSSAGVGRISGVKFIVFHVGKEPTLNVSTK